MKNIILVVTIISSLFCFSGKNIINNSQKHKKVIAKHLKDCFPKTFYIEQTPRLLKPKGLTKQEHKQVSEYVNSVVDVIET
jgi:hypothetical protein